MNEDHRDGELVTDSQKEEDGDNCLHVLLMSSSAALCLMPFASLEQTSGDHNS